MEPEVLRYFRQIPTAARVLVSEGETVEQDSVVARIEAMPGRMTKVNAASTVGVDPRDLPRRMVKRPGDHVKAGEAVAARSEFFDRRAVRSPVNGVISAVSRNLGYVYVREIVELGEAEGPVTLQASQTLRISPKELDRFKSPGIKVGAIVAKGQVLASVDRGPRSQSVVVSPIYGRIRDLSLDRGTIAITPVFPSPDVRAYIQGRVTAVIPDRGVEITGRGLKVEGIWGLGGEAYGPVRVIRGDLAPSSLAGRGAVLAVEGTASVEAIMAAADMGVAGMILGYMPSETVLGLVGAHGNLGITGDEAVPYPVVVLEGFHPMPIRGELFATLDAHEGETVSIRGVTHIRAGVIRPEVVLPTDVVSLNTTSGEVT